MTFLISIPQQDSSLIKRSLRAHAAILRHHASGMSKMGILGPDSSANLVREAHRLEHLANKIEATENRHPVAVQSTVRATAEVSAPQGLTPVC
jgi:hypothetical protein